MTAPDTGTGPTADELAFMEGFNSDVDPTKLTAPQPAGEAPHGDLAQGLDTEEGGAEPLAQDPSEALPDDLRNRWKEMESANQSMAGELARSTAEQARLRNDNAAMAGRLKPLQQRLADIEKAPAPTPAQALQQTQEHSAELDAVFNTEKWKQYEQVFPTEADSLRDVLTGAVNVGRNELKQKIADLDGRLSRLDPVIERAAQREVESEFEGRARRLAEQHPDYRDVDKSQAFRDWLSTDYLQTLPSVIRNKMAESEFRAEVFSDPASVSEIITQFKARQSAPIVQQRQAAPARSTNDTRLALSAAPNVQSGGTRRPNLSSLSPEEQFAAGYNA